MHEVHKAGLTGRVARLMIPFALVSLVLAAAIIASPQVAPVNIEPPTITGTPRVGEALTAQNGNLVEQPDRVSLSVAALQCRR